MRRIISALALSALLLAACGTTGPTSQAATSTTATPSPTPSPLTAGALVDKLKTAGLPVGQVIVFTADTDSNHLLGRPHQYAGKATWQDTRVTNGLPWPDTSDGGSVETFASVDDLQTRASYLAAITKSPLFAEYEYNSTSGLFILRVSGDLTPDQAKQYADAVRALYPDLK